MESHSDDSRLQKLIRVLDRPLLILALASVALYLMDLQGLFAGLKAQAAFHAVSLAIDLVFVADLLLKIYVLRAAYLRSAWFVIDLLSCLPIVSELIHSQALDAIRVVRGLRFMRMLRTLRVLRLVRAMRAAPVLQRIFAESRDESSRRALHRALRTGVLIYSAVLLLIIFGSREYLVHGFRTRVETVLQQPVEELDVARLNGSFEPPSGLYFSAEGRIAERERTVYFSLERVVNSARQIEFFLVVGTILAMILFGYIMAYQVQDVTLGQLRSLLNIALPRQVAARFIEDPHIYEQKQRAPATIMFMDFVGFTRTCEQLGDRVGVMSKHLEAAMDVVVATLLKQDLIIDKFIGDAIMSFRGGPLVEGEPDEHAYRIVRAALESATALRQLGDEYFFRVKIGGASDTRCLIGAFGTSTRLSYTALGDGVNTAARLEPASGQCGTDNLFCESTYRYCADRDDLVWRRWGNLLVPGKAGPLAVYEALDATTLDPAEFIALFADALEEFAQRNFQKAKTLFLGADESRMGGDAASRVYVKWCDALLEGPVPQDWQPVFVTKK